jgi:hypothetical protein
MTQAIQFVLAGRLEGRLLHVGLGLRRLTAQAGKGISAKCSANANAYARQDMIGVIGTFNRAVRRSFRS